MNKRDTDRLEAVIHDLKAIREELDALPVGPADGKHKANAAAHLDRVLDSLTHEYEYEHPQADAEEK